MTVELPLASAACARGLGGVTVAWRNDSFALIVVGGGGVNGSWSNGGATRVGEGNDRTPATEHDQPLPAVWDVGLALLRIYPPTLAALGTAGNAASAAVLLQPALRRSRYNALLAALAAFDTLTLWATLLFSLVDRGLVAPSPALCKSMAVAQNWAQLCAVWTIVVATCQRYQAVARPLRHLGRGGCRGRLAPPMAAVCLVAAAFALHNAWTVSGDPLWGGCRVEASLAGRLQIVDAAAYGFVPIAVVLVANARLVAILVAVDCGGVCCCRRRGCTLCTSTQTVVAAATVTSVRRVGARRKERQATVVLLSVAASFLAFALPSNVIKTYEYVVSERAGAAAAVDEPEADLEELGAKFLRLQICHLLMSLNHATNFLLYVVVGQPFRRELAACVGRFAATAAAAAAAAATASGGRRSASVNMSLVRTLTSTLSSQDARVQPLPLAPLQPQMSQPPPQLWLMVSSAEPL